MRSYAHFIFVVALLTMVTPWPAWADDADDPKIRDSVVKIFGSVRQPDPFRPWTKGSPHDITGSGVVIAGKRILTNAHVVNHASQVFVQPDKSSEKLSAKVEALAPGIDLAVLKLDDESFFDHHPALPIDSKVPALQQTIFAYGYPEGGSELSITRGIVSRVEFTQYYLLTEGLRIQVDAAINPGNSGGPAVSNGKLIGVVFSRLQRSDNIGYIIPMEEIDLFLKDIQDGSYNGNCNSDVSRRAAGRRRAPSATPRASPACFPSFSRPTSLQTSYAVRTSGPGPISANLTFFQFFRATAQTFLAICRYIILVTYRLPEDSVHEPTAQLPPLSTAEAPRAASATARGLPGKRTAPPRIALYPAAEVRQVELPV